MTKQIQCTKLNFASKQGNPQNRLVGSSFSGETPSQVFGFPSLFGSIEGHTSTTEIPKRFHHTPPLVCPFLFLI